MAKYGHEEYWLECVETSLDEMGIPDALTKEQREQLAHDVQMGHENIGMAFGYDAIPNPMIAEVESVKRQAARDLKAQEDVTAIYKRAACNLAHVNPDRVYVNNGEAFIDE